MASPQWARPAARFLVIREITGKEHLRGRLEGVPVSKGTSASPTVARR